jgi:hypothetical protein
VAAKNASVVSNQLEISKRIVMKEPGELFTLGCTSHAKAGTPN